MHLKKCTFIIISLIFLKHRFIISYHIIIELARKRREDEKREADRKIKEAYRRKIEQEEYEALEAERIVKELERQEAEYIRKLQVVQHNQDEILNTLGNSIVVTYDVLILIYIY